MTHDPNHDNLSLNQLTEMLEKMGPPNNPDEMEKFQIIQKAINRKIAILDQYIDTLNKLQKELG